MGGKATERGSGRLCKLSGAGFQNHHGGVKRVSQINGELRFGACLLVEWGEGSTEEQWYLPACQSLERTALTPAPLALTLKLV